LLDDLVLTNDGTANLVAEFGVGRLNFGDGCGNDGISVGHDGIISARSSGGL